MVGDGISLDPTSCSLLAPVSGTVSNLHSAHHALTIISPEGVEVMVHIGIDTVMLKGQGFQPLVAQGQQVKAGQPLIDFELDLVARKAQSLLTQIIITNGDATVSAMHCASGQAEAGKTVVLELNCPEPPPRPQPRPPTAPSYCPRKSPSPIPPACTPARPRYSPARRKASRPISICSWASSPPTPNPWSA